LREKYGLTVPAIVAQIKARLATPELVMEVGPLPATATGIITN
jgi:hypothetical protein